MLLLASMALLPAGAAHADEPKLLDTVTPMSALADKDYGKKRIT